MKITKKTFVVGRKPTRTKLIIAEIFVLIVSLILSKFFMNLLKIEEGFIIIAPIFFILLTILYLTSFAVDSEHWDISEEYLEYYSISNFFDQIKYVINIMINREEEFALKIQLNQIKSIRIYWTSELCIYSTIAHPIYFGVTLKDGSIITFKSLVTSNNQEYIDAIKYLQDKCNIEIVDKYNILDVLGDSKINLVEYIDDILKKEKGSEV